MLFNKEKELIFSTEEFLSGNETAFDRIVKLTALDITNIAYRYAGNPEDAKDICQESLIKIYKKLKFFRHDCKISTWIYRVVVNTCIDFLRKKKKIVPLKEELMRVDNEKTAAEHIDRKSMRQRIKESLEVLSPKQKNALILKHFEGLKITQISKILKCSESSVKTHLIRAIRNVKKRI